MVNRIIARPLDRSRPLWELYVIEGVENGRYIAQLNKIHHATIDGAAGVLMLGTMLDEDPDAARLRHRRLAGRTVPRLAEMLRAHRPSTSAARRR